MGASDAGGAGATRGAPGVGEATDAAGRSRADHGVSGSVASPPGPRPTLGSVMREPRWIAALVLALVLAAVFAALGRWQAERAVTNGDLIRYPTETVRPLLGELAPGAPMTDPLIGQRVSATATFVPRDYGMLAQRENDGVTGWWVVGHALVPDREGQDADLAVAVGWTATRAEAAGAVERLRGEPARSERIVGRLLPPEDPGRPPADLPATTQTAMSVAAQANLWRSLSPGGVFTAYLVEHPAPSGSGLTSIDSPPPIPPATVNWLNVFYAIEWAIFAGFALYLWYRLARDAWEKRIEDLEDAEADAERAALEHALAGGDAPRTPDP